MLNQLQRSGGRGLAFGGEEDGQPPAVVIRAGERHAADYAGSLWTLEGATWAVLENSDRLEIGGAQFRFEASASGASEEADDYTCSK